MDAFRNLDKKEIDASRAQKYTGRPEQKALVERSCYASY